MEERKQQMEQMLNTFCGGQYVDGVNLDPRVADNRVAGLDTRIQNIGSGGSADLITNKRNIKTTAMAENGQMIILGGLIDDTLRQNVQKVPLLGDVPLLGGLFRSTNTEKIKRNLMVFLRPVILRDSATTSNIAHGKYDFLRAQQLERRDKGVKLMPAKALPVLRDRKEAFTAPSFNESDDLAPHKPVDSRTDDYELWSRDSF